MRNLRQGHQIISSHYDRVTPAWEYILGEENLHYGLFRDGEDSLDSATTRLTAYMAECLELSPDTHVIDIGCGIGGPACLLAKNYGCRVTGISISEVGLQRARERAERTGMSRRVDFRYADATANELPDASYDRAWIMESSHLMEDKRALMRETARVLQPGGKLILCDIIRHADLPIAEIMKRGRTFGLLQAVFGRAKMETLGFYRELAAECELSVLRTEDVSDDTRPTFGRWRENAHANRVQVESYIGTLAWQQFVDACEALEELWSARILGYGILLAEKRA